MAFQELMKKNNLLGGKYGIEPLRISPPAPSCPQALPSSCPAPLSEYGIKSVGGISNVFPLPPQSLMRRMCASCFTFFMNTHEIFPPCQKFPVVTIKGTKKCFCSFQI